MRVQALFRIYKRDIKRLFRDIKRSLGREYEDKIYNYRL